MFEIEKGVAIPRGRGMYPFRNMEVGDSFFVPGATAKNLSTCACQFSARHGHGWKFSVRTVDGGVRVWRTN